MKRKIPPDAFDHYVALGEGRSYAAVAERYGVTKQAVTKCAARERWQQRLSQIEAKSRVQSERNALEGMAAIRERHFAAARVIQAKALEALRSMSLESALDAVRALDIGIKQERILLGEPSERTAISIEEVIKREYERWMAEPEEVAAQGREGPE